MNTQPEIDEIDIRILKTLIKNPRTSLAEIAKDCKITTNAIRMRFNLLKKEGVITGSTILLSPKSLGYEGVAFIGINSEINEESNVLQFLEEIPNIARSESQIGNHNIISIAFVRNIDELMQTIELIRNNPLIWNVDTTISESRSETHFPENLVFKPSKGSLHRNERLEKKETKRSIDVLENSSTQKKEKIDPSYKLDNIELSIIKTLGLDSRASFRKIGKKLGLSTKTVIKKFEKIEKALKPKLTITLNLEKIGYSFCAIFCINISENNNVNSVFAEITQIPNIIMVTRCVGDIEILARAPFADFEELLKLHQEISRIAGIKKIEILLERIHNNWPPNMLYKL